MQSRDELHSGGSDTDTNSESSTDRANSNANSKPFTNLDGVGFGVAPFEVALKK